MSFEGKLTNSDYKKLARQIKKRRIELQIKEANSIDELDNIEEELNNLQLSNKKKVKGHYNYDDCPRCKRADRFGVAMDLPHGESKLINISLKTEKKISEEELTFTVKFPAKTKDLYHYEHCIDLEIESGIKTAVYRN